MAKLKVKYSGLKESVNNWKKISNDISSSVSQLSSVLSAINGNVSIKNLGYGSSVGNIKEQLASLKKDFEGYSKTIEAAEEAYRKNEEKVISLLQDQGLDVLGYLNDLERSKKNVDLANIAISAAWDKYGSNMFSCEYNADPVNMSTGNYIYEKSLIKYNYNLPISFNIFYNAMDKAKGALGNGWVHSFETHLHVYDKGIYVRKTDGSIINFIKKKDEYVPAKDKRTKLIVEQDKYTFIDQYDNTYIFDEYGNWLEISTKQKDEKLFAKYDDGLLINVTNIDGVTYELHYDDKNRLINVINHNRSIEFVYENDKMIKVIDANKNEISYQYDLNGLLFSITNSDGITVLKNYYDEYGRVLEQRFPDEGVNTFVYDDKNKTVVLTQQNGNKISYIHDDDYNSVETIYEDGKTIAEYNKDGNRTKQIDKNGNAYYFNYDTKGNLISINQELKKTSFGYNDNNLVNKLSIDDDLVYESEYDEFGREISFSNALGSTVKKQYDENGRLIKYIQEDGSKLEIAYDDIGNISYFIDPIKGKVAYEYDEYRRVISYTDALGRKTSCTYDDNDNLLSVTNPEDNVREYSYDSNNNLIKIKDFDGSEICAIYNNVNQIEKYIDQQGNETTFAYDLMWNLKSKKEPNGAETLYGYDQLNRLNKITYPDGGIETAEYDPNGNIIKRVAQDGGVYEVTYDSLDRGTSIKDPVGNIKTFKYDKFDSITEINYGDDVKEEFVYDKVGQCVKRIAKNGYTTYYSYNDMGNIVEVSDDEGWLQQYEYLPGGLLKRINDSNGSYRELEYDKVGNIIKMHMPDNLCWTFTYDSLDQIIKVESNNGLKEEYEYDAIGNVIGVIDGLGNKTSYSYNKAGKLNEVIDPEGNQTIYHYDVSQRLISIIQSNGEHIDPNDINNFNDLSKKHRVVATYSRDLLGRIISSKDGDGNETTIQYDKCGRILKKTLPEGNFASFEYNLDGTRKSYTLADGKKAIYEYNGFKQLIELKDWLGSINFERDSLGNITKTTNYDGEEVLYEYDIKGRKTKIQYPNKDVAKYLYDSNNRLSKYEFNNDSITYKYDDFGRLIEKKFPQHRQEYLFDSNNLIPDVKIYHQDKLIDEINYQLDAKGQIISKTDINKNTISYEYDRIGQLSSVLENNKLLESYKYDAFGNRIQSIKNNKTTNYQYNKINQLIKRIDESVESNYSYDRNGNLLEISSSSGVNKVFEYDSLDYIKSAKVNNNIASYCVNAFGNRVSSNWTIDGNNISEKYIYDQTLDYNNLLVRQCDSNQYNILRDDTLLGESNAGYFTSNELFSPVMLFNSNNAASLTYDAFGLSQTNYDYPYPDSFGFTGYICDPISGMYHADQREYDPYNGIFTSVDPIVGLLFIPLTFNAYRYCINDPVNLIDPLGLAWLSLSASLISGAVNAVKRVATVGIQYAYEKVTTGTTTVKWQDVAGAATGGFAEGFVFVSSGFNYTAAKIVGDATETFTTNTLKHICNEKGYRKEDGYSMVDVIGQASISIVTSATTSFKGQGVSNKVTDLFGKPKLSKYFDGLSKYERSFRSMLTQHLKYGDKLGWSTLKNGLIHALLHTGDRLVDKVGTKICSDALGYVYNEAGFDENAYCVITSGGSRSLDDILDNFNDVHSKGKGGKGSFGYGSSMGFR